MTNAEKYLKDGVDIEQLARNLGFFLENTIEFGWQDSIVNYFKQKTKPTLTEDERVILRNIGDDCISLIRKNGEIYFHTEGHGIFPNLFQFIKEGEEYEISELLGDE